MDIEKRCNKGYLQKKLSKAFPNEKLTVVEAYINTSGKFINKSKGLLGFLLPINRVHNLPEFCHVVVEHSTGKFTEKIFIWSPVKWNDRFLGCVGGGTATGGEGYINAPDNTSRSATYQKPYLTASRVQQPMLHAQKLNGLLKKTVLLILSLLKIGGQEVLIL